MFIGNINVHGLRELKSEGSGVAYESPKKRRQKKRKKMETIFYSKKSGSASAKAEGGQSVSLADGNDGGTTELEAARCENRFTPTQAARLLVTRSRVSRRRGHTKKTNANPKRVCQKNKV